MRLNDNDGFTLIEALLAMLVLSIGIMALYELQMSSTQGNATANHLTIASVSGVNVYERLQGMPYDDPTMDPAAASNPHSLNEIAGIQVPANVASITWNVVEWSNTDPDDNDGDGEINENDEENVKHVTLTVTYSDRTNKTLTVEFLKTELY